VHDEEREVGERGRAAEQHHDDGEKDAHVSWSPGAGSGD
jgi:hypothetical protein